MVVSATLRPSAARFPQVQRLDKPQLAHFTAEAGKVYYFRTKAFEGKYQVSLDFDPIDSDQGRFFVASYPLSVSHPKRKR